MARGSKCDCGCGQKSAATVRQRKLTCTGCGCLLRMSRTWLHEAGAPSCSCGAPFEPDCLHDRCCLPGAEGEAAMQEFNTRDAMHGVLSERAQKAAATRKRRRTARLQVAAAGAAAGRDEIPF
jgi:hypothetical protein